jgi:hypothetical protein
VFLTPLRSKGWEGRAKCGELTGIRCRIAEGGRKRCVKNRAAKSWLGELREKRLKVLSENEDAFRFQ